MNIDKKALKGVVDEIEASRARQRGETEHQREVMKRAKAHQLDAKAIRIVLQRRAMGETKRDEQDYYVHSYELALGGKKAAQEALEGGASVREAARAGGISTGAAGNLARAVQKSSIVDAPHHPDTGEITETADLDTRPGSETGTACGPGPAPLAASLSPTGSAHDEGEEDGHRDDGYGEGRGSEGLQPERQSGRGGHQGDHRIADLQDGADSRPQQRAGGERGGGGDHEHPDGQHVVRAGGNQGPVAGEPEVARVAPPVAACAHCRGDGVVWRPDGKCPHTGAWVEPCPFCHEKQTPPTESNGLDIPSFLDHRVRA